jgi:hypothetical protein
MMQRAIGLAGIVTLLSASVANAAWCGATVQDNAVIECGYVTVADCQKSVGKGGFCFVDPDIALKGEKPAAAKPPVQGNG